MKITIDNEDYNLDVDRLLSKGYLKPVKKTENKKIYALWFDVDENEQDMYSGLIFRELNITETTAQKLSEAISALVEFVQGEGNDNGQWPATVSQARESMRRTKND